jgi:hypothetical protein
MADEIVKEGTRHFDQLDPGCHPGGQNQNLSAQAILSPIAVLLDVAMSAQAVQDAVEGTLGKSRADREILQAEPVGLVLQGIGHTYDFAYQFNVMVVRHPSSLSEHVPSNRMIKLNSAPGGLSTESEGCMQQKEKPRNPRQNGFAGSVAVGQKEIRT